MRLSLVVHVCGLIIRVFGLMFAGAGRRWPWCTASTPTRMAFLVSGALTTAIGHAMRRAGGVDAEQAIERMRRVEGLAVVSLSWLFIAWFAALPYLWVGLEPDRRDVRVDVGPHDHRRDGASATSRSTASGIFFWRSMTQWLGGMGVIALFVAVLPRLAIGGREIFFAEASGPDDEKVSPQIRRTAALLWRVYAGLTVLQTIALRLTGLLAGSTRSATPSPPWPRPASRRTRCRSPATTTRPPSG